MSERLVLKNRLKEARQAKGLSQAALAEMDKRKGMYGIC